MLYIVYLVSIVLYIICGISWDRITSFVDVITLEFLVFPCVLMLFCTSSFRAFGRAFLFAVGKRDCSFQQCRESAHSVKMVMQTAAVFGAVCFLIGMVNSIRSQYWSSTDSIGWICLDSSVAILSLFYALLICMLLLPMYFMLKKHLFNQRTDTDRGN